VYLRLQELGKASGILLLPPGAMDRLIAARQAESLQPTLAYDPARVRMRRLLLALIGATIAAAAGVAAWWFWLRQVP
jgi:hypothetical protein